MAVIGLTGSIASGKSLLAARLAERGAVVIDADALGHALIEPGGAAFAPVVSAFGGDILAPGGGIDRGRLGERVFADPAERARLNALVHPHLVAALARRVADAEAKGAPLVVVDAALIYEIGIPEAFDAVVVVRTTPERQLAWLRRRGLSETAARQRIAAQMPPAEKARRARFVVDNDGPPEAMAAAADRLIRECSSLPVRATRSFEPRKDVPE